MRKTLGAAETESQSASGSEAIGERLVDIRNARAMIFEHNPNAGALVILDDFDLRRASAAIVQRISS